MYGQSALSEIDWSRYRLTPTRIIFICGLLLSIAVGVSIIQFSQSRENILPGGAPVGGDYVAFYGAAVAVKDGDAAKTYDYAAFETHLLEVGPPRGSYTLTWQYPPTYFLIIAPLAFLPFIAGYIAWTGGTAALYFAALQQAKVRWLFLFVILSAPSTFHAIITGQNGFLTATLLLIAALYPDKRPIIAGLAAALLTVKPQIGVLLPIAYIAAGCWRAFFIAATGSILFAMSTVGFFGIGIWEAFLVGADEASHRLQNGILPLYKMVTPYAWLKYSGAPLSVAIAGHTLCALIAVFAVTRVWLRVPDHELRAAALGAAVFIVAPYGYYYEMIILAFPIAILAKRGLENGWLRFEEISLALMFIGPMMMPGQEKRVGVSVGFLCVALVAASVFRRIEHDYPGTLTSFRRPSATAK
ncbi:MAG: glycosyltransferase family 87 protein [Pseudomonadota bacterium]